MIKTLVFETAEQRTPPPGRRRSESAGPSVFASRISFLELFSRFEFQVLGIGLRVSMFGKTEEQSHFRFGFCVLNLGFGVGVFRFWAGRFGFRVPGFLFRVLDFVYLVSGSGRLGFGFRGSISGDGANLPRL